MNARSRILSDLRSSAVALNALGMREEAPEVLKRVLRILDGVQGFER